MSSDWDVSSFEADIGFSSSDLHGSTVNRSMANQSMTRSLASSLEMTSLEDVGRWEIDPAEISVGKELGKGAFGRVYKGDLRGKEVAIKKLNIQEFDDETLDNFKKEVEILSKLRHPNVVLFMGACFQPGNYMIVTELLPKGSLYELLKDDKVQLSFKRRMKMARDTALGMNWLHCSKPVFIHRDLKTSNLLVDSNWNVKVADFGLSHIRNQGETGSTKNYGAIGTPLWMAPEVLQNKKYDESADVYSFGIVLWELFTQKDPFPKVKSFSEMMDEVVKNGKRPEIPQDCPASLRKLIVQCWDGEPAKRPKFSEIIPMFNEIIIDAIISDEKGRRMWKKYFLRDGKLHESVSWRNFVIAFTSFFKERTPRDVSKDTRWKCMKAVVADDKERVSMEQFSKLLDWFGPLKDMSFLDDVQELLKKDWFHGEISSTDAEKNLSEKKKGTFLVRFSSRDPGCFAISVVSQGGRLKHYRVYHKPGLKYLIGKTECSTLEEIIEKYHKELYLRSACPGSPFQDIFEAPKKNISAGYLVPDFD